MRRPFLIIALVVIALAASGCTTRLHYCSISHEEYPQHGTVVSSFEEESKSVTDVNGSYSASSSGGGTVHGTYESHSEEHKVSSSHRVEKSYGATDVVVKTEARGNCPAESMPTMPPMPPMPEFPAFPDVSGDAANQTA